MPNIRDMDEADKQRLIKEAQEDNRTFRGYSASSIAGADWETVQGGIEPNKGGSGETRWHEPDKIIGQFDAIPDPVKRTPQQRVDSFSSRLWNEAVKNPALMEHLVKRVQGEFWKQGRTVTYEQCRAAAAELLLRAEKEAKK
jgi:hypothetical protein